MPFADLHCDTISRLHQRRRAGETLGLLDGQGMHINLEKLKQAIPFGPFLCAAAVTAYFWGREIITWYWRMFL